MEAVIEQVKTSPSEVIEHMTKAKFLELLEYLSEKYYNEGVSVVSDQLYDFLKDSYVEKYGMIENIGSDVRVEKVKLPYYLGSLDKIKREKDILLWQKTFTGSYIVSNKLDGMSGLLRKKNGKLNLYTRGDGFYGLDRSCHVKHLNILEELNDGDAIRGELIISRENFETIKHIYANARNAVAGIINSKTSSKDLLKLIDFVPYMIMNKNLTFLEQLQYFKYPVSYKATNTLDIKQLSEWLDQERKNYKYEIDGLVIFDCMTHYPLVSGENPRYGFSFKQIITDTIAETVVVDVIWEISKHKYIKPTVKIVPVEIGGCIITHVTAHNAKNVVDNVIGVGSVVEIIKAGEVIPYIYNILKPSELGVPKMPNMEYEWNATGVDIVGKNLKDEDNKTVVKNQLIDTFAKLKISFLGEGTIKKLLDNGFDDFWKILYASDADLLDIDGFGHTLIDKIIKSIRDGIQNASLFQLLPASQCFGRGIGERKFKIILEDYPNILEIYKTDKNNFKNLILNLNGFSHKTADLVVAGMDDFIEWYDKLQKFKKDYNLDKPKKEKEKKTIVSPTDLTDTIFLNKKVCFSGIRDPEYELEIEKMGGKIVSGVSGKTDILVIKNMEIITSKIKKSQELNIMILTEEELLKHINIKAKI